MNANSSIMALSVHEDRRDSHTVMARLMERIEMDCAEDEEEEEGRVFVAISSSALLSVVVIAMMVSLGGGNAANKSFPGVGESIVRGEGDSWESGFTLQCCQIPGSVFM